MDMISSSSSSDGSYFASTKSKTTLDNTRHKQLDLGLHLEDESSRSMMPGTHQVLDYDDMSGLTEDQSSANPYSTDGNHLAPATPRRDMDRRVPPTIVDVSPASSACASKTNVEELLAPQPQSELSEQLELPFVDDPLPVVVRARTPSPPSQGARQRRKPSPEPSPEAAPTSPIRRRERSQSPLMYEHSSSPTSSRSKKVTPMPMATPPTSRESSRVSSTTSHPSSPHEHGMNLSSSASSSSSSRLNRHESSRGRNATRSPSSGSLRLELGKTAPPRRRNRSKSPGLSSQSSTRSMKSTDSASSRHRPSYKHQTSSSSPKSSRHTEVRVSQRSSPWLAEEKIIGRLEESPEGLHDSGEFEC